jgi:formylglycine-generating enzyme required for sulfatase activity
MRLVRIPAGKFLMGSPDGEGSDDERPEHEVEITRAFHMGAYEVTQKQFEVVMGYNPSHFSRGGEGKGRLAATDDPEVFPVENVSWDEAKRFCEALSALPDEKEKGRSYRLPTEAEWEYACRGGPGPKTPYHFGTTISSNQANFDREFERPRAVGSYAPNAFGLHDMHGNVWEWCADWFGSTYYQDADNKRDPPGPRTGTLRVLRGGSWSDAPVGCRAAYRTCFDPAARLDSFGFRVCFTQAD